MRIAGQWLPRRLKGRLLDAVDRCDLLAILSRDSYGEVPMFESADGGWVVE
jgi:hypothetical protein